MKRLGRLCPKDFIRWLFPQMTIQKISFEDREFELTHRRVDILYKVKTKRLGEFYIHLEFQVELKEKDNFSIRLHEYATRIRKEFGLPVKTVGIFLDSTKVIRELLPVDRSEFDGQLISEFHYTKIILPDESWENILAKDIPALFALIPVTKIPKGEAKKALSQAAKNIEKISDKGQRGELAAILYLIGGYKHKEAIGQVIGEKLMLDLMESATYRETIEKGEKKKAKDIAKNMLTEGCSIALITKVTGLTANEIRKLKAESGKTS